MLNAYSTPFRLDYTAHGGDNLLYAPKGITSKLLLEEENPIEGFFEEITLRIMKKWLIGCSSNPINFFIKVTQH